MAYAYFTNDKDCFNTNCPFRANKTSSVNYCQCADICPNRAYLTNTITTNRTIPNHNPMSTNATEVRSVDEPRD